MNASTKRTSRLIAGAAFLCVSLFAQTDTSSPTIMRRGPAPDEKPAITLSPAVIMIKGQFGAATTQTLTLTNRTAEEFAFEMIAQDVVVRDGQRVFVNAGELANGMARSADFSVKSGVVKPFTSVTVDVRLTIPKQTDVRAVVAIFRGTHEMSKGKNAVGMIASLGTLITFSLTDGMALTPAAVKVTANRAEANVTIAQPIANSGTEPVVPQGVAAILNRNGTLVAKSTFEPQRLLPGERLTFTTEYSGRLAPGSYKVLCSFEYEGKELTSSGTFDIR